MHIVIAINDSEPSIYALDWMISNILKDSKNHKDSILTVVEPPVQAGYYYAASGGKRLLELLGLIHFYFSRLFCQFLGRNLQESHRRRHPMCQEFPKTFG